MYLFTADCASDPIANGVWRYGSDAATGMSTSAKAAMFGLRFI